jgi:DNA-binding transcriptional LysR family regulator
MSGPDLNLLFTLDALLQQGSVVGAGHKLGLSPSAMSRALARLRTDTVDLYRLDRTFVLRTSDGFAETIGPALIQRVAEEAPRVRIRFIRKLDKDSTGLRDGAIDLETGVVGTSIGPEVRAQALFEDRYVGVVRAGHPLAKGRMTAQRYAEGRHVLVTRQGLGLGAIDEALETIGLARTIVTTVDGFAAALALARGSDLVSTVPERHTLGLRDGMETFALPVETDAFTISLLWHPRMEGDASHRWLRQLVRQACDTVLRAAPGP